MEMAQMRALETQRYYAYSTNNGPSAIFDRNGNVLTQTRAFEQTTLSGHIFAADGDTPFMRWGTLPLILGCALGLLMMIILRKKKPA
jgi:apolipoprotein N-acyltransferase